MVGTIPVPGDLSMDALAATLSRNEQLGQTQLTALAADNASGKNLATFIAQPAQLGLLAIVASGASSPGTKILSVTAYVSGAQTAIDVYRLAVVPGAA